MSSSTFPIDSNSLQAEEIESNRNSSNQSSRFSHPSRDISNSSIGSYNYSETETNDDPISISRPSSPAFQSNLQPLHSQLRNLKQRKPISISTTKKESNETNQDKGKGKEVIEPSTDVGTLDQRIYDAYLPPWVAKIRRIMIRSLKRESEFLAWQQVSLLVVGRLKSSRRRVRGLRELENSHVRSSVPPWFQSSVNQLQICSWEWNQSWALALFSDVTREIRKKSQGPRRLTSRRVNLPKDLLI